MGTTDKKKTKTIRIEGVESKYAEFFNDLVRRQASYHNMTKAEAFEYYVKVIANSVYGEDGFKFLEEILKQDVDYLRIPNVRVDKPFPPYTPDGP